MLPEMWNTGYALEQIDELADQDGERTKSASSAFAVSIRYKYSAGRSRRNGRWRLQYNYVFDERGESMRTYSKIHLFRLMDEEKHLQAGDKLGS